MTKPLLARVRQSLDRDRDLPLATRTDKVLRSLAAFAAAPLFLSALDHVGERARAFGRPRIENGGRIDVGDEFAVINTFSACEIVSRPGARVAMGDAVVINFGTSIVASKRITIGDGVKVGPYCILADAGDGRGVEIGDDVWLSARVTVLPGTRIGARTVVSAGSVVSGDVPADAVVSGVPGRVLRGPRGHALCAGHDGDGAAAQALRRAWEERRARELDVVDAVTRAIWPGVSDPPGDLEIDGRPFVKSRGKIDWGDAVVVRSRPTQSHVVVGPRGYVRVGDGVVIEHGAAISAEASVHIGEGTRVGPFAIILDSDFHRRDDHDARGAASAIRIGNGVRIGPRVTVLRGATIGDGAVIEADSVVSRNIPPHAMARGVPARPI